MKPKIIDIDIHRNGITGAPFYAVLFDDGDSRKVGIVFDRKGYCAVLDITKLCAGDIAFRSNSWRGDAFESDLREFIGSSNDSQR